MSRRRSSFLAPRSMAPHEAQAPVGRPCHWLLDFWTPHPVLLLFVTLPPLSSWPNALSSALLRSPCYQGPRREWSLLLAFSLWRDKGSVPASGISGLSEQPGQSLLDRDLPAGLKSRPGSAAHLSVFGKGHDPLFPPCCSWALCSWLGNHDRCHANGCHERLALGMSRLPSRRAC